MRPRAQDLVRLGTTVPLALSPRPLWRVVDRHCTSGGFTNGVHILLLLSVIAHPAARNLAPPALLAGVGQVLPNRQCGAVHSAEWLVLHA